MIINIREIRAIKTFCKNQNCPLKAVTERISEIRSKNIPNLKTLTDDIVQLSQKQDLSLYEEKLGRILNLGKMSEAQVKTDSICNSISLNKTLDCIHDSIGYMGEKALEMPGTKEFVAKVDNAIFNEIPKTTKDVILYRGESYPPHSQRLQEILMMKPGDNLKSNRYTYLTEKLDYAQNFQGNGLQILYKTLVPQNSNIAMTTLEKGCAIAPRNSAHKILNIEQGVGKITITSILETPNKPL